MELRPVEVLRERASNSIMDGKSELRPSQYSKGLFHCWEHHKDGENFSRVYGIVEFEDGKIGRFETDEIRFVDNQLGKEPYMNVPLT